MVLLNVALPLMYLDLRALALFFLVPIVIVEAAVVRRMAGIPWFRCLGPVAVANAATTLLGYPLGWLLMRGVRAVTGSSFYGGTPFNFPWDLGLNAAFYDTWLSMSMSWPAMLLVYAVSLLLLVLACIVSIWVETWICAAMLGNSGSRLPLAVRKANLLSYAFLGLLLLALAVNNLAQVEGRQVEGRMNRFEPVPASELER